MIIHKKKIICLLFIIFSLLLIVNLFFQIKYIEIFFSIFLLIFIIYFFILPEKFIIGGLESNLIFLDKILYYDNKNKKQKYFFSKKKIIIFIRAIIFIFAFLIFLWEKIIPNILISSLIFILIFYITFKILNFFKIKQNSIISSYPRCVQKNIFYKLLLSSTITGIAIGLSCGSLLKNNFATGGTDIIFLFLHQTIEIPISIICLLIDGSTILLSFIIDLKREKLKNQIIIKYILSIFIFFTAISIIHFINIK
ncbi:hypothetical protein LFWB_0880 [Candidatus Phytoplasma luffae]|uniref:Uncharacterized protein n=1 Tax=Loofah witches'-broom phytoplasma TaxID=35773 RepID=A0A975FHW5_LOWBP|nr:YitT family protein [Candidatus Phytoplasma luffae]QTX02658.1 hypothetical protein LFWB_0880 [Candidatus Phytoplasma luffae]